MNIAAPSDQDLAQDVHEAAERLNLAMARAARNHIETDIAVDVLDVLDMDAAMGVNTPQLRIQCKRWL